MELRKKYKDNVHEHSEKIATTTEALEQVSIHNSVIANNNRGTYQYLSFANQRLFSKQRTIFHFSHFQGMAA